MNALINTFGGQKRWVHWNMVTNKDGRTTKVPVGSSTDPKTWSLLEDLPNIQQVGLVFGLKKMLLGIDIDHCLVDGKIIPERTAAIENLIRAANTYCEVSPSGTGLHLFLQLTAPLDLKNNKSKDKMFECYTHGRYFTVTFRPFGEEKEVRTVTPEEAIAILGVVGYPWEPEAKATAPRPASTASIIPMDSAELLKKMFASKNGKVIKALWDGDTTAHGDDYSAAELALCLHLAFWTQGDKSQIEALWLSSPLGSREKTQSRADYRGWTIDAALAKTTEYYKPRKPLTTSREVTETDENGNSRQVTEIVAFDIDSMKLAFTTDKDGNKKYSLVQENINILLAKHPVFAGRFRYDEFMGGIEIKVDGQWRSQRDSDEIFIQSEISNVFPGFNRVSPMMVQRAIVKVAKDNTIDSAKDYVTSLKWDRVARIDQWLQTVFGVEDIEYTEKVGANWLKGLVKRIIEPGCQFDYVLVVEGKQGLRKSSAFRELVTGNWHLETERSPGEKDFFVEMAGKAVVELSEGQSNATVDVKKMKSILTKRKDTYRSPYGRIAEDHPRRSVFCMTTNDDDYLKDTTGDRRWWPVECTKMADVEWIKQNRDQLFAEAYYRLVELKETTYEVPTDVALDKQEERRRKEPNTDLVVDWYQSKLKPYERAAGISVHQAFLGAFHPMQTPTNLSISRAQQMEISAILVNTLKLEKLRKYEDGARQYLYYQKGAQKLTPEEAKIEAEKPVEAPIEYYESIDDVK